VRIGIISDTHLGLTKEPFEEETLKGFVNGLKLLKEKKVDLVIHAGDIFDKRTPRQEFLFLFLSQVMGLKIFAINGNHDTTKVFGKKSPLDIMEEHLAQVLEESPFVGKRWEKIPKVRYGVIEDEINLIGIDYVRNKDFLKVLNHAQAHLKRNPFPNILVMHQDLAHQHPEGVPLEEIQKYGWDLIINGHVHQPHYGNNLLTPGSTAITRFHPDEFTTKYVWIWEDGRLAQLEIPGQKKGKEITLDLRDKNPVEIGEALEELLSYEEILYVKLKLSQRIDLSRYLRPNIKFKVEIEGKEITLAQPSTKVADAVEWIKESLKGKTSLDIESFLKALDEEMPPMQLLEQLVKRWMS